MKKTNFNLFRDQNDIIREFELNQESFNEILNSTDRTNLIQEIPLRKRSKKNLKIDSHMML